MKTVFIIIERNSHSSEAIVGVHATFEGALGDTIWEDYGQEPEIKESPYDGSIYAMSEDLYIFEYDVVGATEGQLPH
jgi:hypothetical protein